MLTELELLNEKKLHSIGNRTKYIAVQITLG